MKLLKKLFILVVFSFLVLISVSCTVSKADNSAEAILKEYNSLVAGETTKHTKFSFKAKLVNYDATVYNASYQLYELNMILQYDDLYIGIVRGLVDGAYPKNIDTLEVGKIISVVGEISEIDTLTSGAYEADVCFYSPEVKWGDDIVKTPLPDETDNPTIDDTIKPSKDTFSVNFAMINDTHGAFNDSNDGFAISRVDSAIDDLTSSKGEYIKIANGDILQGSYESSVIFGLPIIESLNAMDFDCFVIGNHEFDWGLDKIALYKDGDISNGELNAPFLAANLFYKNTTNIPEWIEPYTIVNYDGIKVGIIGLIGGTQESSILTENVTNYDFLDDPSELVASYAYELRVSQQCDMVVLATHEYDNETNLYDKYLLKDGYEAIDAIFCAHTHQLISTEKRRADGVWIPVVQNYHKNKTLQDVTITYVNGVMSSYTKKTVDIGSYPMSDDLTYIYEKYNNIIEEGNRVLGINTNFSINKSTLGNYSTKSMLNHYYNNSIHTTISVAIMNTGGIRATIDFGDITVSDVFNVVPFNNEVFLCSLTGKQIKALLSESGLYYSSVSDVWSFNDYTYYSVAVIDYVYTKPYFYNGHFINAKNVIDTDIIMRDLLIDYIDDLY